MKKMLSKIAQELTTVHGVPVTLGNETFPVEIKQGLNATEYSLLVRELASWSFSGATVEDGTEYVETIDDYAPEKTLFARRYLTLRAFTNIEFPEDMNEVWALVMNTDLYDQIYEWIDEELLEEIYRAARRLVDARVATLTNRGMFNDLLDKTRGLLERLSADIDRVDINEVLSTLKDILPMKDGDVLKAVLDRATKKD